MPLDVSNWINSGYAISYPSYLVEIPRPQELSPVQRLNNRLYFRSDNRRQRPLYYRNERIDVVPRPSELVRDEIAFIEKKEGKDISEID
jgi:hypothetical protein